MDVDLHRPAEARVVQGRYGPPLAPRFRPGEERDGIRPGTKRKGTAVLEFLTVFPILAFVVLAGIDLGRCTIVHQHVVGALQAAQATAAEQAYSTATQGLWEQEIRRSAEDHLAGLDGFDPAKMNFTVALAEGSGTEASVADIGVGYPFRTIVAWPGIPQELMLRHQGRVERRRR